MVTLSEVLDLESDKAAARLYSFHVAPQCPLLYAAFYIQIVRIVC